MISNIINKKTAHKIKSVAYFLIILASVLRGFILKDYEIFYLSIMLLPISIYFLTKKGYYE